MASRKKRLGKGLSSMIAKPVAVAVSEGEADSAAPVDQPVSAPSPTSEGWPLFLLPRFILTRISHGKTLIQRLSRRFSPSSYRV